MTPKLIIGICGHAQAGKDTVEKNLKPILSLDRSVFKYHVGDDLSKELADMTGGSHEEIQKRKATHKYLRRVLQFIGDIKKQEEGPDVFVKKAQAFYSKLPSPSYLIIPSVRLKIEADWIKSMDGIIVRVFRPDIDNTIDDFHVTESEIRLIPFDYSILNDSKLSRLDWFCKCLANDIIQYANKPS